MKRNENLNLWVCKKCGHNREDHIEGLRCAFCWGDAGYDARLICNRFEGNNLELLEALDKEKDDKQGL